MDQTSTGNSQERRTFKPSWIDRLTDWVERLPLPSWLFYALVGIALILLQVLFLWLDGGLKAISLLPIITYNALGIPYAVAIIQLLDNQAVAALNSMRPALELDRQEFEDIQYRLSTMPARNPLIVGGLTAALLFLSEKVSMVPLRYVVLESLPVFSVVYHFLAKLTAAMAGVFVYHTIRQLRLVNAIHSRHARINLFDLTPLYAFSMLTRTTALALVIPEYGWLLINPELMRDPLILGGPLAITLLAVAMFTWPLLGAHRLMEQEKQRLLHELDLGLEKVFSKFNEGLEADNYAAIDKLNGTIASLETQYRRISSIPTWPWRPETARFVMSLIAAPLILTVIQFIIGRLFGR